MSIDIFSIPSAILASTDDTSYTFGMIYFWVKSRVAIFLVIYLFGIESLVEVFLPVITNLPSLTVTSISSFLNPVIATSNTNLEDSS